MAFVILSCSEKHEDIAAPAITIYHYSTYLANNDTVSLTNGFLEIEIEAKATSNVNMDEMTTQLVSLSEAFSFNKGDTKDDIKEVYYWYPEDYDLRGITNITKMKLTVTCSNESENLNIEERTFYVKP